MVNENCLKGMRCPNLECRSEGPFVIQARGYTEVSDDGTDFMSDVSWEDDAKCSCRGCGTIATVHEFTVKNQAAGNIHECDNCGEVLGDSELKPIVQMESRVEAGKEVPSGECPYCGALTYIHKKPAENIRVTVEGGVVQRVDHIPEGMEIEVWNYDDDGTFEDADDAGKIYGLGVWGPEGMI